MIIQSSKCHQKATQIVYPEYWTFYPCFPVWMIWMVWMPTVDLQTWVLLFFNFILEITILVSLAKCSSNIIQQLKSENQTRKKLPKSNQNLISAIVRHIWSIVIYKLLQRLMIGSNALTFHHLSVSSKICITIKQRISFSFSFLYIRKC